VPLDGFSAIRLSKPRPRMSTRRGGGARLRRECLPMITTCVSSPPQCRELFRHPLPDSERRASVKEAALLDLLIRDASNVDGTGAPARVGDRGDGGYGLRSGRDK